MIAINHDNRMHMIRHHDMLNDLDVVVMLAECPQLELRDSANQR